MLEHTEHMVTENIVAGFTRAWVVQHWFDVQNHWNIICCVSVFIVLFILCLHVSVQFYFLQ